MLSSRSHILLAACVWGVVIRVAYFVAARLELVDVMSIWGSLWAVAPLGATLLFGGARVSNRWLGLGLPLVTLLLTNLVIGLVMGNFEFYSFYRDQGLVVLGYLLMAALGATLPERASLERMAGTAVLAELVFFLVTNFGFWAVTDTYPHTMDGLLTSYLMGLPFLLRALVGMAFYATALFGAQVWAERPARIPATNVS
ncbi:MAG: DUF6580 family putative transport protein [Planctomycetaceae bacterium]|jgi:hypothetical protein